MPRDVLGDRDREIFLKSFLNSGEPQDRDWPKKNKVFNSPKHALDWENEVTETSAKKIRE